MTAHARSEPSWPGDRDDQEGRTYYGEATILGKPYVMGYEPIRDAAKNVIGICFGGYMK
jgi:Single cache domain 3